MTRATNNLDTTITEYNEEIREESNSSFGPEIEVEQELNFDHQI